MNKKLSLILYLSIFSFVLLVTSCTTMLEDFLNVTINYSSQHGKTPSTKKIGVNNPLTDNELPIITADGYTFDGWYATDGGGDSLQICKGYIATKSLNLQAKWTLNEYNIKYELNDGIPPSIENPTNFTVETPTFKLNKPTRPGYGFAGWYLDKEFSEDKRTEQIEKGTFGDITLYASWLEGQSDITINYFLQTEDGENYPSLQDLNNDSKGKVICTYSTTDRIPSPEELQKHYNTPQGFTYHHCDERKAVNAEGTSVYNVYYTRDRYTISFDGNKFDGGTVPTTITKLYGVPTTIHSEPNITRTGYAFDSWNTTKEGDGKKYESNSEYIVNEQATLYAKWNPIPVEYTVNFYLQDTDGINYSTINKTVINKENTETVFTVDQLKSLYKTPVGFNYSHNDGLDEVKPDGNSVYNLYYTRDRYTILFDGNNNTSGDLPSSLIKLHDVSQTIPGNGNLKRTGYKFVGWCDTSNGEEKNYQADSPFTDNKTITLYAKWIPVPVDYKVNFFLQNETKDGYPDIPSQTYTKQVESESLVHLDTLKSYHDTTGFTYSCNDGLPAVSPFGDTVYNLYYERNVYSVRFDGNGSTEGTMENQNFTYGVEKALTTNTYKRTGYEFTGWKTEQNGSVVYSDEKIVHNLTSDNNNEVTLYASWNPLDVNYKVELYLQNEDLTYSSTATQTSNTLIAKADESLQIQNLQSNFTVAQQYAFDNSKTDSTFIVSPDGHSVFKLYYKLVQYNISFNANGGSGTTPQAIKKTHGIQIPLPSGGDLQKTGYLFNGWDESKDGINAKYSGSDNFIENKETLLYAKWKPISYKVAFKMNNETESIHETKTINYDSDLQLPSNPSWDGYTFVGWSQQKKTPSKGIKCDQNYENSKTVVTKPNLTSSLDNTVTLYAVWLPNDVTITVHGLNGWETDVTNITIQSFTGAVINVGDFGNPSLNQADAGTFSHWCSDSAKTQKITNTYKVKASGNDIYAKWNFNAPPTSFQPDFSYNDWYLNTEQRTLYTNCRYGTLKYTVGKTAVNNVNDLKETSNTFIPTNFVGSNYTGKVVVSYVVVSSYDNKTYDRIHTSEFNIGLNTNNHAQNSGGWFNTTYKYFHYRADGGSGHGENTVNNSGVTTKYEPTFYSIKIDSKKTVFINDNKAKIYVTKMGKTYEYNFPSQHYYYARYENGNFLITKNIDSSVKTYEEIVFIGNNNNSDPR